MTVVKNSKPVFDVLNVPARTSARFDASAPHHLLNLYHGEKQGHLDRGLPEKDAHHRAIRTVQHMGWYKGRNGWSQVLPDLRKKINITEAVRQPDGNYFIEGIPCFYPNAVKGPELAFSANDITNIIRNTNASIASGAPKPAIVEGHPNSDQGAIGIQLDSHGSAVNFREHPDKPGWVICDFIDVEPEYVRRLQARRLPSLSLGLAKDAKGLNRRFGHVALLGGTSQALSHLPATEVFSAVSGTYLMFSADTEFFPQGTPMSKLNATQRARYEAYMAYDAAEKSCDMAEPGADAKLAEAYAAVCASEGDAGAAGKLGKPSANFDGMPPDAADTVPPMTDGNLPMAGDQPTGSPSYDDTMPAPDTAPGTDGVDSSPGNMPMSGDAPAYAADGINYRTDPDLMFEALREDNRKLGNQLQQAIGHLTKLRTANSALVNKQAFMSFSAEIDALRKSGRTLPTNEILREQFDACLTDSKDPKAAIARVLKGYKSLPASRTPATVNRGEAIFSAQDSAGPSAKGGNGKPPLDRGALAREMYSVVPDADDIDLSFAALGDKLSSD
jgi:hypothetical protein